jgi:hypothetical protein
MFHYTTNVNKKTALVSCHFNGWHGDLYNTYFDDFVKSHIDFAQFNDMDYHCFNGGILEHYNIPVNIATKFMGLSKWFLVMYAFEMGYENVFVTDIDTKFLRNELFDEEIPYQSTVMVSKFEEQKLLIKIVAEIVVQRESQKAIILGTKGAMIKKLGMLSRQSIEQFLDSKVYLELFVKVRSNWRNNDLYLKEYGYIQ